MASIILAAVEDLFFLARIQETARRTGVGVEAVNPATLGQELQVHPGREVSAIILDLNCRFVSAVELLRALKTAPSTRGIPVVGFVSHVQGDLIAAARSAGCDTVLARSAFTAQLPELLTRLASTN
ncbi:MAG TPA: response regulator [Terriglobia bacterium]|nr:response regulator [Terriglobia bacterium]